MAAYAALNSLMYILQQIQNHPRPPITLEKQHMDSLSEIISYLQDFLEKYSHRDIGDGKEALESQIANAVYAAEDVIESHIVNQILVKSNFDNENNLAYLFSRGLKKILRNLTSSPSHKTDQVLTGDQESSSNSFFCKDLEKVIEDMNLIKKEVMMIEEKIRGINDDQLPRNIISMSAIGSSTVPPPKRKITNTMVGFDDVFIQIMDRLTGDPPNRQVLPIVGMGGIDWEDMSMIGSLPRLQVLKLKEKSFSGPAWNPVEGEFLCLKFLLIEECPDLVNWNANRTHFPCLEQLHLCAMTNLKEIPLDIGEIPTLRFIKLERCSDSAVISTKEIVEEQENLGNVGLQVEACLRESSEVLQSLASDNFRVYSSPSNCTIQ